MQARRAEATAENGDGRMTGGLALSPLMRELVGLLNAEWRTINTHTYPRKTARALQARGLAQVADIPLAGDTYQARLTAGGVRERQRLVDAS